MNGKIEMDKILLANTVTREERGKMKATFTPRSVSTKHKAGNKEEV